jgi:hypothetical protein
MLNKKKERELVYVVKIDKIEPIIGSDNCEAAVIGGWKVMVRKDTFKEGDYAIYFEIDSKVPETKEFEFLAKKHYKVKTQKYTFGGRGCFISQGLIMSFKDFADEYGALPYWLVNVNAILAMGVDISKDPIFLTKELGVTYAVEEDNKRKANINKYDKMYQRHVDLFKKYKILKKLFNYSWGKKILFIFLGKKRDTSRWPTGRFPGVAKTDQERCENMTWVLDDKTPFIVTQKCDGSSGTYILERKPFGQFEFYVCSRNVRMFTPKQKCFYGDDNFYWEVAIKYNIENKMKDYLKKNKDINFVCWQGEICAPKIQGNPHKLTETHFYCFHMTDSKNGRYDIRKAKKIWEDYNMEIVPIINENYIMPDDFEEFKITADGVYDTSVCEGHDDCIREGFVYYKTTDPNFSFKNVSREYLIKRGQ